MQHLYRLAPAARCSAEANDTKLVMVLMHLADGGHSIILPHCPMALIHNHTCDLLRRTDTCMAKAAS